jgi:hypothetical protein
MRNIKVKLGIKAYFEDAANYDHEETPFPLRLYIDFRTSQKKKSSNIDTIPCIRSILHSIRAPQGPKFINYNGNHNS